MKFNYYFFIFTIILIFNACNSNSKKIEQTKNIQENSATQTTTTDSLSKNNSKMIEFDIIKKYPHDKDAYTQGLLFYNDYLYESTGLYGQSSLRKVQISTGEVIKKIKISPLYFGEGITKLDNKIYQLTWENHKGFIYDMDFAKIGEFSYPGEGWGITTDGKYLIISDGSNYLSFY